jgi:hypothetical protein
VIDVEALKTTPTRELRRLEREAEEKCLPRQVTFVRNACFEGMSLAQAYEAAGYDSERPNVQSSKLMKKKEVIALTAIYMEVLKRDALISNRNLQLAAYEVLERAMAKEDNSTALRAIDQLTKMTTGYKQESTLNVNDSREQPVPQMGQETLKEMFKASRLKAVD